MTLPRTAELMWFGTLSSPNELFSDQFSTRPHVNVLVGSTQLVFEGDYSTPFIGAAVIGVVASGYGMMYFGMRHQQYKQGYWK